MFYCGADCCCGQLIVINIAYIGIVAHRLNIDKVVRRCGAVLTVIIRMKFVAYIDNLLVVRNKVEKS